MVRSFVGVVPDTLYIGVFVIFYTMGFGVRGSRYTLER